MAEVSPTSLEVSVANGNGEETPARPSRKSSQAEVFSFLDKTKQAATLSWTDLTFTASSKKGEKKILNGITGALKPGKLTCILGPSGAGKTSFMNVLAGRVKPGGSGGVKIGGTFQINGNAIEPHKISYLFGYVMQEDTLFATSTPREVMEFSAKLRLREVSADKLGPLLSDMLGSLGLAKCADTIVGNELIKGISGGEKKRAAIGAELITNPKITFLDEPTSGLDTAAAYTVVSLLKQLADMNQSVMCTIHQPSSEIFMLFDSAIFLAPGKVIYQGPPSKIRDHFGALGHQCPVDYNPADFVMHLLDMASADQVAELTKVCDQQAESVRLSQQEEVLELPPMPLRKGFLTELGLLALRELRNVVRDKASLGARFGSTVFLSVLFGVVFWQVGDQSLDDYNLQSHMGGLTMVGISGMFGAAQPTLLTFPSERPVFLRESAARMYGIAPYFLSKSFVELPLIFATSLLSLVITYWMIGFQGDFVSLLVPIFLIGAASSSVALVAGSAISDVKTVQELTPILFVPQILFAGFFVKMSQIPVALRWVQYLCTLKWGMNAILTAEFDDTALGRLMLEANDVDPDHTGLFYGILLGLFVFFRALALIILSKKVSTVYG